MAMQVQQSPLAALGNRLTQAVDQFRDRPVEMGMARLPPGVRAVVKITGIGYGKYRDNVFDANLKGKDYWFVRGVVVHPETHNGMKIDGIQTSVNIPLCDTPGQKSRFSFPVGGPTFNDHWCDIQNFYKWFDVPAPPRGATAQQVEAYYAQANSMLTDPKNPRYVTVSTRAYTPNPTQRNPKPEPNSATAENWEGPTEFDENVNPAGGIVDNTMPPQSPPSVNGPAPAPPVNPTQVAPPSSSPTIADEVAVLVKIAMADPDGHTPDGLQATERLEQLAFETGATEEQVDNAENWEAVGKMVLGLPSSEVDTGAPAVGSKWMFAKRDGSGNKLKNRKGQEFPPQEVEVATVSTDDKTCTVKDKDGKDVTDLRSSKPVNVKWEWLEPVE